jgi:hypothetical protein
MTQSYIERVLLVAGAQDTGKSTQLRSMFVDPRFGTSGTIPTARRVPESVILSPGRQLYLRLTSPHERGENAKEFLAKIVKRTHTGRWCVASAVQVYAARNMPGLVEVVGEVIHRLAPERVRVAILSPDRHGSSLTEEIGLCDSLWGLAGCEVMMLDARSRTANGYLLADTFDFT